MVSALSVCGRGRQPAVDSCGAIHQVAGGPARSDGPCRSVRLGRAPSRRGRRQEAGCAWSHHERLLLDGPRPTSPAPVRPEQADVRRSCARRVAHGADRLRGSRRLATRSSSRYPARLSASSQARVAEVSTLTKQARPRGTDPQRSTVLRGTPSSKGKRERRGDQQVEREVDRAPDSS